VHKKSHSNQMTQINSRIETKVAKTIFFVTLAFLASWMPYAIVSLLFVLGYHSNIVTPAAEISCAVLAKCSVIWNPLIYVMTNNQLKKSMMETVRSVCMYLGCNRKWYGENNDENDGKDENLEMVKGSRKRRSIRRREEISYNTEFSVASKSRIVHHPEDVAMLEEAVMVAKRSPRLGVTASFQPTLSRIINEETCSESERCDEDMTCV
ncbi:melanopsin-A, partial [Octopus bimaculoides]